MWIVSLVCMGLGSLIAIGNIAGALAAMRNRRKGIQKGYSSIPLLSLILCGAAYAAGGDSPGLIVFLPCLFDPGTWLTACLPYILYKEFVLHREP